MASASANHSSQISLPSIHIRLDRNNYAFWRYQVLATIRAHGFDDLITQYLDPPPQFLPSTSHDRVVNPDFQIWIRRDQLLLSWLIGSIAEVMIGHITRCVSSRDLWFTLEALFQSQSKARVMQLKLQLQTQKKGDLSIDEFFLKMRGYADSLAAVGKPVADDDLILHILGGFGAEYDAVVVNLTNRSDALTLQEVQYALQAHEVRLQSQISAFNLSANLVHHNSYGGRGFDPSYGRGRGDSSSGRGASFRGRGGRGFSRDTKIVCQLCGKTGHVALKCFKRFDVHFTGISAPQAPQAYFADFSSDSAQEDAYYAQQDQQWYADSGATAHVTNDISNLQVSAPYSGSEQLQVGNGNVLSIAHVGNSCYKPTTSTRSLLLSDVLHVPGITKNLVSISKFTKDNHVFVELHPDFCCVKDITTHKMLMRGALDKGLYQLDIAAVHNQRKQMNSLPSSQATHALQTSTISGTNGFVKTSNKTVVDTNTSEKQCIESVCLASCTVDINEWHRRLGHPNLSVLEQVCRSLNLKIDVSTLTFCEACKLGKLHQKSHVSQTLKTSAPFQLVHSDLWGPAATPSSDGYSYYIHFVDDFSRFTWIFPLHLKSEASGVVKRFLTMVNVQFSTNVQCLQTDWGGEFRPLESHLADLGIKFQHPCPHIHAQNGKAERKHQHILHTSLTLLAQAHLPFRFWWDAVAAAVYLINRLPSPTTNHQSPFQVLHHTSPDYNFLHSFGCACFPLLTPYNKHKLQFKSSKCVFLGYSTVHKGYKCLSQTGRLYISDSVIFNEQEFPYVSMFDGSSSASFSSLSPSISPHYMSSSISLSPAPSSSFSTSSPTSSIDPSLSISPASQSSSSSTHSSNIPPPTNTHSMTTRAKNGISKPKIFLSETLPIIPTSVPKALADPAWYDAMAAEFKALQDNNTWILVPNTGDQKLISCKWVFRVKTKADGSLDKLKARLVARGFEQLAGVDFMETFSPVVKFSTIRLVFTLAAVRHWNIQQIDVNNAFLNGDLQETIYMVQPRGFEDIEHPSHVCKLTRSLYGLKQAPRAWYDKLKSFLISLGFKRSTSDFSLFHQTNGGQILLVLVYVDDILITGDDGVAVASLIQTLNAQFALKVLGDVSFFLGIEVSKNAHGFLVNQSQYILDILEKTNLLDCKSVPTPMLANRKLSKTDGDPFDNPTLYRSTVGSLQYLTLTRPDIAFAVNKLSQFLQEPTSAHWGACKHLLRYLKGSRLLSLAFTETSSSSLEGFSDADWASCVDDRRSTGGHCLFLGNNLLVWSSKKQDVVARSSAESEYRALANAASDLVWFHSLCCELGVHLTFPSKLWCDNSSAIALASNPVFHARTKHIEVDVHYIREKIADKTLEVGHVPSTDQVADIFTKPLSESRFLHLRHKLHLQDPT